MRRANPAVIASARADGTPHLGFHLVRLGGRPGCCSTCTRSRLRLRSCATTRLGSSLTILDDASWYRHITLVGRVAQMHDDEDLRDIDRLALRYTGANTGGPRHLGGMGTLVRRHDVGQCPAGDAAPADPPPVREGARQAPLVVPVLSPRASLGVGGDGPRRVPAVPGGDPPPRRSPAGAPGSVRRAGVAQRQAVDVAQVLVVVHLRDAADERDVAVPARVVEDRQREPRRVVAQEPQPQAAPRPC